MTSVVKKQPKVVIPMFASIAEWFDKNRKRLEADMRRRLAAGDTKTLAAALKQSAGKEKLKPVTIRMRPDDLEAVRGLALEKGLPYQTYIKVLLREGLRRARASRL